MNDLLNSPYLDFARRKEAFQHTKTISGTSDSNSKRPAEVGCTFCEIVAGDQSAFKVGNLGSVLPPATLTLKTQTTGLRR